MGLGDSAMEVVRDLPLFVDKSLSEEYLATDSADRS
jgi:hypothetical protein